MHGPKPESQPLRQCSGDVVKVVVGEVDALVLADVVCDVVWDDVTVVDTVEVGVVVVVVV